MNDLTHTRLPETGTPPALAAARLEALIAHALTHPQQAPARPRSATILAFKRHAWTTGLATAGLAAAIMLAVMPGTFNHLTRRSTITAGGLAQTAMTSHDDLTDIDDMLTLNTLDSFGSAGTTDNSPGAAPDTTTGI